MGYNAGATSLTLPRPRRILLAIGDAGRSALETPPALGVFTANGELIAVLIAEVAKG